jgi:hypothetical protein
MHDTHDPVCHIADGVVRVGVLMSNCKLAERLSHDAMVCRTLQELGSMKYLCLIYQDEAKIAALPAGEYETIVNDVLEFRETLRRGGNYITSSPLQSVQTAMTIRVRRNNVTITDGPFAETREQLGGFYLIEATDLNDAIRLASKMPPARIGSIEVRPLDDFCNRQPPQKL